MTVTRRREDRKEGKEAGGQEKRTKPEDKK
jgi:hypothetical protein